MLPVVGGVSAAHEVGATRRQGIDEREYFDHLRFVIT